MRLKPAICLAALLGGLGWGGTARAAHCGAGNYPAACCSSQQCSVPNVGYCVGYQTIVEEQPCMKTRKVYRTVLKECRTTCYKKVYEQRSPETRRPPSGGSSASSSSKPPVQEGGKQLSLYDLDKRPSVDPKSFGTPPGSGTGPGNPTTPPTDKKDDDRDWLSRLGIAKPDW